MRETMAYLNFNRGIISPLASGRVDIKRTSVSAETMVNWTPRVFGSMMLRPGLRYVGGVTSDSSAFHIPFIFSSSDTSLIEMTNNLFKVRVGESFVTRPTISSSITNGNFDADLTGWTDSDEAGGVSAWETGGYMGLTGNGSAAAIRDQTVSVGSDSVGLAHGLAIVIERGPVYLRVGSSVGADDYVREIALNKGRHSIQVTPSVNFTIRLFSRAKRLMLVTSCGLESAGQMSIVTEIDSASLSSIRHSQSGNVIYVTTNDLAVQKINRRASGSWSFETMDHQDGPFLAINVSPVTISSSAISGNVTLTSSAAVFSSLHVGSLFKLSSLGQVVTQSVSAQNVFTNTIRVTGIDSSRVFTIVRAGTWVATVTLQRSLTAATGPWEDVTTYATNATVSFDDTLDNVIAWYRIGVKTGNYTSGTVDLTLNIPTGSIDGVAKITTYSSSTSVSAEVIVDLGNTSATENWYEGAWSSYRGFPNSTEFAEGRVVFAGKNGIWCSVSDAYESFDIDVTGDSGPIIKTIGFGPVDSINWILGLKQLLLGGDGIEYVLRSSSIDEPLTPSNSAIRRSSSQGSASVGAGYIDNTGIYVQRGGHRVMEISIDKGGEYASTDITLLCPEVISGQVVRIGIQRQPDTRIHCILNDGSVAIGIIDRVENVLGWFKYTSGFVEDVVILPGAAGVPEDKVYYVVKRTINSVTKRFLESFALESECAGGTLNKQLDSFILYSGVSTATIIGLSHLEGQTVHVWGNGNNLGSYVVTGNQITGLTSAVTEAVIGLAYTAQWKSFKLGRMLGIRKHVDHIGVIARNIHPKGLTYGHDFGTLYDMPEIEGGTTVGANTVRSSYDEDFLEFSGEWDTDSRVCLEANAPKPCTLIALVVPIDASPR